MEDIIYYLMRAKHFSLMSAVIFLFQALFINELNYLNFWMQRYILTNISLAVQKQQN